MWKTEKEKRPTIVDADCQQQQNHWINKRTKAMKKKKEKNERAIQTERVASQI